jgi:hypothetical protein
MRLHVVKKSFEIEIKASWITDLGSVKWVSWFVSPDNLLSSIAFTSLNASGIEAQEKAFKMAKIIAEVGFSNFQIDEL